MKNNRAIEYKMTETMFRAMLEQRTEDEEKMNPYAYVMSIINEQYNLLGVVTKLSII